MAGMVAGTVHGTLAGMVVGMEAGTARTTIMAGEATTIVLITIPTVAFLERAAPILTLLVEGV